MLKTFLINDLAYQIEGKEIIKEPAFIIGGQSTGFVYLGLTYKPLEASKQSTAPSQN